MDRKRSLIVHVLLLLVALSLLLVVFGCGGGFSSALTGKSGIEEKVWLDKEDVISDSIESTDTVTGVIGCEVNDVFSDGCNFESVNINFPTLDYSFTVPLGVTLKNKEQKPFKIKLADISLKTYGPFAYLRDVNPSTAYTEWTVATEVLSKPETVRLASGYEICHVEDGKEVCVPGENFTATLSGSYIPGTLAIYGGSGKLLEETSFGLLTGQGSGSIEKSYSGYVLNFHITGGVPKGASIVGAYLPSLKEFYVKGLFTLQYGDLTLTLDKGLLKDSGGKVYGVYDSTMGMVDWVQPIGFRNAAIVAMYETDPWQGYGGEVVGEGDGVSTVYEVQTKYPYIKDGTLKVFADTMPGDILFYDKYTGKVTVRFNTTLPKGTKIRASYVIYRVSVPVELTFKTQNGEYKKNLTYTVTIQ